MPGKTSRSRIRKPDEVEALPTPRGPGRISQQTDPPVALHLLGTFALRDSDRAVASLPKKAQALLAYLAMRAGRAVPREQLADLLWGRSGGEQARRSLRQCLMSVRSALDAVVARDVLATDIDSVMLSSDGVESDVTQFVALSRSSKLTELQLASDLYRGDFLSGLQISEEPFTEWMSLERRRLSSMMSDVLYRLAAAHADAGDTEPATRTAERLTAHDPLREDGHRLLMQLLAAAGHRGAALKQYALCAEALKRQLGVAPEPATTDLADAIRTGNADALARARVEASTPRSSDRVAATEGGSPQPSLPLPDKTSIAVLPFSNLSGDSGQDYFADGMAEDIAIALGRVPWLFVIASSSSQAHRKRIVDVRQAGAGLGVRYVLRGSVRRSEDRIRVVVQLNDTSHGGHVWADRFEGELGDVFAIQDRVTTQVCATLAPALQSVEIERAKLKPTENLTAYDLYLRALPRFRTTFADNQEALRLLYRAIELDPSYAGAYAFAARCYQFQRLFGWVVPPDPRFDEGVRLARLAAEIGENDSEALWMAGIALAQLDGEMDYSLALIEKSLSLNPNSASAWISCAFVRGERGEAVAALEDFSRAQRLNPLDLMHHVQRVAAAFAYLVAGRYEEAADNIDRALSERPSYTPALRLKVVIYGLLRRSVEARQAAGDLLAANPHASVATIRAYWAAPLRRSPALLAKMVEGARLAGLPEDPPESV